MISLSSILNRLDLVFYIIVFAIIYVAIIYLWKKIAQLESSFYKLETTFATQLLYKNKENNANQFAEDMFMKVFDNKPDENVEPVNIEIVTEQPTDIVDNSIISEITEILTPSVDDNLFTTINALREYKQMHKDAEERLSEIKNLIESVDNGEYDDRP